MATSASGTNPPTRDGNGIGTAPTRTAGADAGGSDDEIESDDDIWETDDEEEQDLGLGDESSKPSEAGSRTSAEAKGRSGSGGGGGEGGEGGSALGTLPPISPSSPPKVCVMSGSILSRAVPRPLLAAPRSSSQLLETSSKPPRNLLATLTPHLHYARLGIWIHGGWRGR